MNFLGGILGLGFIAGGTLSIYAYRRRVPGSVLGFGSGSVLGALSGVFGFLIFCALATMEIAFSHAGDELRRRAFESMDKVVQNADPELQQSLQAAFQHFKTPEGFALFLAFTAVCLLLMFVFFSTLGGAIGASISRKTQK